MQKAKERRILESVANYLPDFLLRRVTGKRRFDPSRIVPLSGALMQADASGFTKMSEELSGIGRRGAEELTDIFNRFFSLMLKVVFANGGDVLKFGGDSLLVFFQGEKGAWRSAAAALEMQKKMGKFRSISTSCGTFQLALHIGIHSGEFFAVSLGEPSEKLELAILGRNVNLTIRCNEAAGPGETLLTRSCYRKLEGKGISEQGEEFYKLLALRRAPKAAVPPGRSKKRSQSPERLLEALVPYLPRGIYDKMGADSGMSVVESEHRRITILFLNLIYSEKLLKGVAAKERGSSVMLRHCFEAVQGAVADHGGVITRIDPYSDGDKVLVLFGAPVAQEDDEERAILCALKIQQKLGPSEPSWSGLIRQRIGITTGNAFCGEVGSRQRKEYTVMGKDVNLAARLMSKAGPEEILVSERTFQAVAEGFEVSRVSVKVKGISQPVTAFKIKKAVKQGASVLKARKGQDPRTPLIGREDEIRRIKAKIATVVRGRGQVLSIVGEPGIGKSRLTEELVNLCAERSVDGVLVNCHFYGSNAPLLPWVEILKNYCGIRENDGSEQKGKKLISGLEKIDSVRWAPLCNDLLGVSTAENEWTKSLDGETKREILFQTITNLILDHTRGAVSYLIFEDTHWIDQTSSDMLSYFAERVFAYPILLVLVHRPGLTVEGLESIGNYERLLVGELKKEDAFDLARCHLKMARLPEEIAKLIWEKSRGNPLYLQELMHSLLDSGHLTWDGREKRYKVSCEASDIEIPDNIQDVIMCRIDRLEETARKVIKTASVIGRVFSFDTLASVLPFPLSENKLKYWLEHLDRLDLAPLKHTEPNLQYTFKHALTQEVAYNLLPFVQKRKLHLRIGDYYEKKFKNALDEKCELLAHHYDNSDNLDKALVYLIRAGNKGKRVYSNHEAIHFFNRAEKIYRLDSTSTGQKRRTKRAGSRMWELLENRGEVYKLIGEYSQAEKDFQAVLDLAKKARNKTKQGKALNLLGELCWLRSDYPASQDYVKKAYQVSLSQKDCRGLAMCFNNLGDIQRRQGSFEKASESYRSALEHYKAVEDSDGMARSYNNIGIAYWSLGTLGEAAKYFERALQVRRETGDKVGEAKTSNNLALIYQDRGDLSRALEMLGNALEIFRAIGDKRNSGYCLGNMGTIYRSQARYSNALKAFEDSIQIFSDIGDEHAFNYSVGNIGDVLLKKGNLNGAKRRFQQTLRAAERLGDEELKSETLSRLGAYWLLSDQFQESERYFSKALALAEKIKSNEFIMKALAGLTELRVHMSRHHDASTSSGRLLALAQRENTKEYLARGYLLRGLTKAGLRSLREAESDLKRAREISVEAGFQELLYKAHLGLAKLYDTLAEVEGEKALFRAQEQLACARKVLEEIATRIQPPQDRELFLDRSLAQVRWSTRKLSARSG